MKKRLVLYVLLAMMPLLSAAAEPSLEARVDPRVEFMSVVFHLAGNPEYNMQRIPAYAEAVDDWFRAHRRHDLIQLAKELRRTRGVSYDAVMSMAAHLEDTDAFTLRVPLDPWPAHLDKRWQPETVPRFLEAARDFAQAADFKGFIDSQQPLYGQVLKSFQNTLSDAAHLDWFESFFGARPEARFLIDLAPLNGPANYGATVVLPDGEELHCMLGIWAVDGANNPSVSPLQLPTVIHEFCHAFANPLVDANLDALKPAAEKLFTAQEENMRRNAYGHWETLMRESLVRASVIRYLQTHNPAAVTAQLMEDVSKGFWWIKDLAERLEQYEADRATYPTLADYMPEVVAFFDWYTDTGDGETSVELVSIGLPSHRSCAPTYRRGIIGGMAADDVYRDLIAEARELVNRAGDRRGNIKLSPETVALLEGITSGSADAVESAPAQTPNELDALRAEVADCRKCGLCETRTQTVFSDGSPTADLVFVGEAPGRDEDLQGVPFVGRAGQLLTRIIEKAIKIRREDIYICNVLKCRPPQNRDPSPQEKAMCMPYLDRQVELVRPKVICCLGRHAGNTLLGTDESTGRLRGKWHFWKGIPVRVTYHPSYLLRCEGEPREREEKMKVWQDIQEVMKVLSGEESPTPPGSDQGNLV